MSNLLRYNWFSDYCTEDTSVYSLEVEMPGVKPEDVGLEVKDGVLSIRGKRRDRDMTVSRRYKVPDDVSIRDIEATAADGLLKVSLPKRAPEVHKILVR